MDVDVDDENAQLWQSGSPGPAHASHQPEPTECDDYWFIPPYINTDVLLEQLQKITDESTAHLAHNNEQQRIDIWGSIESIQKAKLSLDHIGRYYFENAERRQKATKTKGWAKPERELTPAEKKKRDRVEQRRQENQKYMGVPETECAFKHCVKLPKNMPATRLLGRNLHVLDALRTECKSFIWMEQPDMKLYVAGDDEHSSHTAMNRIKNFIIKWLTQPTDAVCHILEKPSTFVEIHFVPAPGMTYIRPPYADAGDNVLLLMKAKPVGNYGNLRSVDLKMDTIDSLIGIRSSDGQAEGIQEDRHLPITDASANDAYVQAMKYNESMIARNIERIRKHLFGSLDQIQLMDSDLKMRIRFGQVGLREYPRRVEWDIKTLDTTIIPDSRLKSEFSPFFTRSAETFAALATKLTPPQMQEQKTEPDVLWTLGVVKRDEEANEPINVQLDVTFRADEKVAFWNGLVQRMTPLDVRVISSERRFSWAWTITAGRRLPSDKFSAEGNFVHKLRMESRVGQEKKLVFANTNNIQLKTVRREKRTLYTHGTWTIELTEESFWTLTKSNPSKPYQSVTLNMAPDHVFYSVSMYKDSWVSRLSENPYLGLGQVPNWEPEDFLEGEEAIGKTLETVTEVRALIESCFLT
ncbi:hypothetical protein BGZ70_010113 [Mortierella alpina]|uniref:DUF7905 domain-containing protein n=1 Tax=Mortierella alpina TaxID=64518 RepID=A0A9P6J1W0_MORAP|nr:hypothetical protein BGZ70_010113 [Mortierella alpina]